MTIVTNQNRQPSMKDNLVMPSNLIQEQKNHDMKASHVFKVVDHYNNQGGISHQKPKSDDEQILKVDIQKSALNKERLKIYRMRKEKEMAENNAEFGVSKGGDSGASPDNDDSSQIGITNRREARDNPGVT